MSQFYLVVFANKYLSELELGLHNTNFSYKYQKKSLKKDLSGFFLDFKPLFLVIFRIQF